MFLQILPTSQNLFFFFATKSLHCDYLFEQSVTPFSSFRMVVGIPLKLELQPDEENGNANSFFHPAHLSLHVLELFLHLIKSAATTMQTISRCFHDVHIAYERQLISIRG